MQPILFFLVMTLVTGVIYPLAVTAVVQVAFPKQSKGSLILKDGVVIGSELLAQKLEDPKYFWPRPSASDYNAVPSAASNLAPTDPRFPKDPNQTTSGSGLDPHITLDMARTQIARIAKARKIDPEKLEALITLPKKPHVNVFMMNLELDSTHL